MKRTAFTLIFTLILFTGKALGQCTIVRTITGPSSVCAGSAGNVYTTETGMSNYNWNVSSGGTVTSGGGNSDNTVTVTWNTSGNRTVRVNYKDTNNCSDGVSEVTYNVNVSAIPTASAGGSKTICQTGTATVSGATSSNGTISWTHNGAGSLTNASTLTPAYHAAAADAGNTVTLTMTVTNSPCTAATASYSVIVDPSPFASAGGSQTICQTGSATVSGASAANGTILWTDNGAGSLSDQTTLAPTYSPGAGDAGNTVTLTMTVTSSNTCNPATAVATYTVIVDQSPLASAGGSQNVCQTGTATVSGATALHGSILWTHNGAGSLTNATSLAPVYHPAAGDAGNTVTLTMTVTSTNSCSPVTATAYYTVNVRATPTASAGGSQTICQTGIALVAGATSSNGTILWTHNGSGSLTNATSLAPTYHAAAGDAGHSVTLTMTVSNSPCVAATATYTVLVDPSPTASAGGSQNICQTGSVTVSGATAFNGTILWTHNGSGSLSGATTLTPAYTAGATDAGNSVTLTMTVTSTNTCSPSTATAVYTINVRAIPAASAGGSQTICQTGTATVSGATASNGTILWTHNGAGWITNASTLAPVYHAAVGDAGKAVTLTMTVSNSPCTAATATYTVNVDPSPVASAGGSQTICQTGTATVSGASSANGTIAWSHNGSGSLINVTTTTPTYTPVAGDAGHTVILTMTVTSTNSCNPATAVATYTVIVDALPAASAGGSRTICQTGSATVSGASATGGSILWTHNGSGSLTNATSLTPTYFAAPGDAGMTRTLTITVTSTNTCNPVTATATYSVTVEPLPVATAGGSQNICQNGTAIVSGASASNGTILWTHNGSGSLLNASTLTPTYVAAAADAGHTRTLTMTVTSNNSCNPATATATYSVIVAHLPVATAGGSQTICQSGSATVSGANASYGTILWTHNGSGSLSNATTITPTYNPASGDGDHTITLTMIVTSNNACNPATASATYTVIVQPLPTLEGASQAAIVCENTSSTINLLGLLPERTSSVSYSINSIPETAITGIGSDISGSGSFSTRPLTESDNGKLLRITGITTTNPGPVCSTSFSQLVSLTVNPQTLGGTVSSDQTICAGTSPADLTLAGNTGIILKWERSLNSGFSPSTDIPVTSSTLPGATIGNLTSDTWFRAVVKSGVCNPTNSSSAKVKVNQLPLITFTAGSASVNEGSAGNVYTTQSGMTNYVWAITGGTITSGGGISDNSATVTWTSPGAQFISVNYNDNIAPTHCSASSPKVFNVAVNAKPVASNMIAIGELRSNITLVGSFIYSDAENNPEGSHQYQWYRASDAIGTNSAPIASATLSTYKLKDSDTTLYLRFSVIPVASTGATPGLIKFSNWSGPVTNAAPAASSVAISGTKNVGGVLSGHYTYSDYENDLEYQSVFQWYSCTTLNGTYTPVPGEVYNTHLIGTDEQGRYFKFSVIPQAGTGKTTGAMAMSSGYGPSNTAPYADNLAITGSATIGSVLNGSYSYHDVDPADHEGSTTFRWFRTAGSVTTPITGAIGTSYTLSAADEGYTISFEVTPVSTPGIPTGGTPVSVSMSGPVLDPSPLIPVADQVCISGIRKANEVLTGKYNYTFYKSEGTSGYRWLKASIPISGATGIQYTLTQSDIDSGQEIAFEVTPKSSNYIPKSGVPITSNPVARIKLNQTTYSLADTAFVIVPNVAGGVFSGKGVSNGYFSPWNADTASKPPHTVSYLLNIVNSATTCSEQATVNISVVAVNAYMVGLKSVYCYDDKPDTIFVENIPPLGINRRFRSTNPGAIIKVLNQDTIIIDPGKKRPGINRDTLTYSYTFNGSYFPITQNYMTDSVGVALINNLTGGDVFCNNDLPFTMYPSLTGPGGVFSGPVTITVSGSYLLDPSKGVGDTTVTFKYTHSNTGCFSSVRVPIRINPAPVVAFKPLAVCVASSSDSTKFINKTTSVDPVTLWDWKFYDAGTPWPSTMKNPAYLFKLGGDHRITLIGTTNQNCSAIKDTTIGIGFKPVANFYWQNECFHTPKDSISLRDTTYSTATILSRTWKFGEPAYFVKSGPNDDLKNINFIKSDTGKLLVTYIVRTSYSNCDDSVKRSIYIRPTISLITADYFQNFENGNGGWAKENESDNTWSFGKPVRNVINNAVPGGMNAWFTSFDTLNQKAVSSSVISPCFDFTTIQRPLISMQLFKRFDTNRDGAALQYKIGDSKSWILVGSIDDGINWYNSTLIKGKPGGDQQIGWTSLTTRDRSWSESLHALDELSGKKDVKFRIAYGSDGTSQGNEGMAFDDVRIGGRTRKVLLEHFTNLTNVASSNSNTTITGLANRKNTDVINIQYHTNFPGTDAFFNDNPGDASARFLFYGLSKAPYSLIDGGTQNNFANIYDFGVIPFDSLDLTRRSMISPSFAISLNSTVSGGIVTVNGQIKALESIDARNMTLYIVITEKISNKNRGALGETTFFNVFRKFIPDAAGISLQKTWAKGESYTLTDRSWAIQKIPDASKIEVIAFIQNNVTKEIYQSESNLNNLVVGLDNLTANDNYGFSLYPNPASDRLTIEFQRTLQSETEIDIFNYKGTIVRTYKAGIGQDEYSISELGLPNGIYLLKIKSGSQDWGYKKLVIAGQ